MPPGIEPDEIPGTGLGMFGMCACDFWVTRFGWIPVPKIQNNDMLLRVSARVVKNGFEQRAFYTIASYDFPLLRDLIETFQIDATLDCVLFMKDSSNLVFVIAVHRKRGMTCLFRSVNAGVFG